MNPCCVYYYKPWHSGVEAVLADSVADLGDEEVEVLISISVIMAASVSSQANRK